MDNHPAFASGVLKRPTHDRMVQNLSNVARDAGIPAFWISKKLDETCGPDEVEWVKAFKHHAAANRTGLLYVGEDPKPMIDDRMAAIAGCLTRNFIRARLMTINQAIDDCQTGQPPMMSCILIPNFFYPKAHGGKQADWRIQIILDLLMQRHAEGLQSVLYAYSMEGLGKEYGAPIRRYLEAHYTILEV
jgi:hypothetical protein